MRVFLPSNGLFGLRNVDLNVPKIRNVRDLSFDDMSEEQVKNAFVLSLLSDPSCMDKLSVFDRDYLFAIAVSAVHLGEIKVQVTCGRCSHNYPATYAIGTYDLVELAEGTPITIQKEWGEHTLEYSILSVADERKIIEYAWDHESNNYSLLYEEAFIARTLGFDVSDEGIAASKELPVAMYYSANLFAQVTYHGVSRFVDGACPECGRKARIIVPMNKSLLRVDSGSIMEQFLSVSGIVDFQSFLDLSFPEFKVITANVETGAV